MKVNQLTPFLEGILSDVRETCGPSLPNWELALCERLWKRFYIDAVPGPGKPVLTEQPMGFNARLRAVEDRLSASPTTSTAQRGEDLTNY